MSSSTENFVTAAEASVRKSRIKATIGYPESMFGIRATTNVPLLSYGGFGYDGGLPLTGEVPVMNTLDGIMTDEDYFYRMRFDVMSQGDGSTDIICEIPNQSDAGTDSKMLIIFDPLRQEYATEFTIIFHMDSTTMTQTYYANKSVYLVIPRPAVHISSLTFEILKWSQPCARPCIKDIETIRGVAYRVSEDDVIDFTATCEADSKIEKFVTTTARLRVLDADKALYSQNAVGKSAYVTFSIRKPYEIKSGFEYEFYVSGQKWENSILELDLEHMSNRVQGADVPTSVNNYDEITAYTYWSRLIDYFPACCVMCDDFPTENLCAAASGTALSSCLLYLAEWACFPIQAQHNGELFIGALQTAARDIASTNNHYLAAPSVEESEGISGVDVAIYKYEFSAANETLQTQDIAVSQSARYYMKFNKPARNVTYSATVKEGNVTVDHAYGDSVQGVTFYLTGAGTISITVYGYSLIDPVKTYFSLDIAGADNSLKRITVDNPLVISTLSAIRIAQYKRDRYLETSRVKTQVPGRPDLELLENYTVTLPDGTMATALLEKSNITFDSSGLRMAQEAVK